MFPVLPAIPGLGFQLPTFGPMVALGFLLGTWIFSRLARRYEPGPEHDPEPWAEVPIWILVGILVGARLMYVTVELLRGSDVGQSFLSQPWRILAFWQGGLVMYGGFIGGIIGGVWCGIRRKLPLWHGLDLGITAGFFGLCLGRIGCLLVGDDYGKIVPPEREGWPFPVVLRVPDPLPEKSLFGAQNAGEILYATQLWMSFNALCLGFLALWLLTRRRFEGQVSLTLIVAYALTRGFIEFFRGDEVRGTWFGGAVSTSQLISLVAGLVGLTLLLRRTAAARRPAPS